MGVEWNERCASSDGCVADDDPVRHGRAGRRGASAVWSSSPSARGRPQKAEVTDLELLDTLDEPGTRGDPELPLRWTTKSTRQLAEELTAGGHAISHSVVADILHSCGYSLQATRKTLEGCQHPDRDAQFRYLNALAAQFFTSGDPVISVDAKKRNW